MTNEADWHRRFRYSDDAAGDIAGEGIALGLAVKRIEELMETGAPRADQPLLTSR